MVAKWHSHCRTIVPIVHAIWLYASVAATNQAFCPAEEANRQRTRMNIPKSAENLCPPPLRNAKVDEVVLHAARETEVSMAPKQVLHRSSIVEVSDGSVPSKR